MLLVIPLSLTTKWILLVINFTSKYSFWEPKANIFINDRSTFQLKCLSAHSPVSHFPLLRNSVFSPLHISLLYIPIRIRTFVMQAMRYFVRGCDRFELLEYLLLFSKFWFVSFIILFLFVFELFLLLLFYYWLSNFR